MNLKTVIVAVVALLIGVVGTYFLVPLLSSSDSGIEVVHEDQEGQLWTCGMHPDIVLEEPGDCPICGMKLVPLKGKGSSATSDGEREILYWRAPMDPNEIYDEPGKSKMGMDLVPVYADEAGSSGIVKVDGVLQQQMNLQTTIAKKRDLQRTIYTNGVLTPDERKEYVVTTKVSGWVDKLYINYTGQEVRKGQKLLEIYSPELVSAQEEVLTAIKYQKSVEASKDSEIQMSGNDLLENSLRKLRLLDIPDSDINKLIEEGKVKKNLTLYAPFDGIVLKKNVDEGEKIMAGKTLLQIADLRNMWLKADIYENELQLISVGSSADITFNYFPGKVLKSKVTFIYPTVDPKTRTVQVRFDIPNQNLTLKPSMFATVEMKGKTIKNAVTVPEQSIIRSGKDAIVIVALGEGKFKPASVKLGQNAEGYYQVLDGLTAGTKVVTNSQFLIDSESNLRSAVNKFQSSKEKSDTTAMKMDEVDSIESDDMQMSNDSQMQDDNHSQKSELIRKGTIDLKAIDENADRKVYQDIMDWNVISDEPGKCPICGMILKEFTLEQAKENLEEHGFQAKKLSNSSQKQVNEDDLIRTGTIDLQAIDKNDDGKVYQDMMDWNVISDEEGRCPECGMYLKEVSLDDAEKNLIENGYKVK